MAKFACRCGHVIKLQTDRDPEEHVLIKETDIWDRFLQLPTDELAMTGQEFYDFTSDKGADVIICPKCTRVYIDHNGDNRYTAYVNEDNPPAD